MSSRTYHDPLHGGIRLDREDPAEAMAIDLIDTSPFQRLRRIRQLGPASLTFHGAESSRFTHSLGVLQVARQAMQHLERHYPELSEQRAVVYSAALLHDIGHGPLSHSGEEMFGTKHELWSGRLIRTHSELRDRLNGFNPDTAEAVANLLETGRSPVHALAALVSSQLDCDRLDYLLRDSHSTGASFGHLDLERIIAALTLAPDGTLAIHPKGLMAVEHYLVVRQLMYRSVYNHRINVVCNWLLKLVVATARRLGPSEVWADNVMASWLWSMDQLDINTYLANDDLRTGYHMLRWREDGPNALAAICRRLLDRQLPKALDVSEFGSAERLELLAEAQCLAGRQGLEPEQCCALEQRQNRGYHPYKGGLRLWNGYRLQALEDRSDLVQSLAKPVELAWLIHPDEVSEDLRSIVTARQDAPKIS